MPDLHTALEAAITARLEVARAATPGPWSRYGNLGYAVFTEAYDDPDYDPPAVTHGSDTSADAEFIAVHDPADAVRRYERDLRVLARYEWADGCLVTYDDLRAEIRDLLDVYPEVTR